MNTTQIELTTRLTTGPRAVSDISAKRYVDNLNKIAKLATGKDFESIEFLTDYEKISKIISLDYATSTTKNFLNAIINALSPDGKWKYLEGYEVVGKRYTRYQNELRQILLKISKKQELSKKDEENWCDEKVLIKIRQTKLNWLRHNKINTISGPLDPILKKEYMDRIQQALIASLYTMIYTNRNAYGDMHVIEMWEYQKLTLEQQQDNNYYVHINKAKAIFSIGKHKNSYKIVEGKRIHQGLCITPIPSKLNRIIKIWLNYNKTGFFLINTKGRLLGTAGVTNLINKTFESTGKKIGSTLCRKIKISKKFENEMSISEKEEIATQCGHSITTQGLSYSKKNIELNITEKK